MFKVVILFSYKNNVNGAVKSLNTPTTNLTYGNYNHNWSIFMGQVKNPRAVCRRASIKIKKFLYKYGNTILACCFYNSKCYFLG